MTQEGNNVQPSLAQAILPHISLRSIELMAVTALRLPALDERGEFNAPLIPSDSMECLFVPESRMIVARVNISVKAADDKAELCDFRAVYRVTYHLKDSFQGDQIEARAEAFCKAFSLAHVWPYWRELLASLCARMNLPSILAPMLIVGAIQNHKSPELPSTQP